MEKDVVVVFHPKDVSFCDRLLREEVRFERFSEVRFVGGGSTGPVGGQHARVRIMKLNTKMMIGRIMLETVTVDRY